MERSAFTSPTHRDVAFALIKTEGLDVTGRERIAREAQAMGRLGAHPNIVTVFDLGVEPATAPHPDPLPSLGEGRGEGQPYMVTELMAGGDIEGAIAAAPEHKLSLPVALAIAEQVCRGLEFAHARGIVHRDLKPGNVWLTAALTPGPSPDAERAETPVAKIGDFGLAVAIDRTRLTQAGMMVGTVSYMPPEQAMGGEVT
ncbi:MAG TPA: serine/threonine-protein kinase, partial [Gemmataceae bacterium]|nr:serine/threonine-protein kinase [Gemmataceae bacterium]